jgi:hypothetical protein
MVVDFIYILQAHAFMTSRGKKIGKKIVGIENMTQ